ncbi:endonuclease NucS [Herbaspirillum sp. WGmk3]|uniref:endonuclease NucS domain-containing protein n=1 Tax=Herbaspirillum sp. WGmk3 TaxID=2919925 RepID=UPI00209118AE|nr:endonuclease NucS domain-containing protein [Herbaspirillum sp. WGmk3]MCO4856498.1 endonuclease NucS [Herbaspirillum sp. WGmk3]
MLKYKTLTPSKPGVLPLLQAYAFAKEIGLEKEAEEIRYFEIEWDRKYNSKLRRGYIVRLLEEHGVYEKFVSQCWPSGATSDGVRRRTRYLQYADDYDAFLELAAGEEGDNSEGTVNGSLEFALEAHLRDFLAKNLSQIESGLRLYRDGERSGIEYPVGAGRIDILAVDSEEKLVVIELKLSQGRNKALGQLLYYMGWVDSNLRRGQSRGIIIASEISDELSIAVKRVSGISLCQYKMDFAINKVVAG